MTNLNFLPISSIPYLKNYKLTEEEHSQINRFFQVSEHIMVTANPKGYFKSVNLACLHRLGYTEAELLSKPYIDFVHPEDRQSTSKEAIKVLKTGFSINFENRFLGKDGSIVWFLWHAFYFEKEATVYANAQDITKQKQAEEALAESYKFNKQVIQSTQDGIVVYDKNLHYLEWNPFMEKFTGIPEAEVLGKHPSEVFPFLEKSGVIDNIKKALCGEVVTTDDFCFNIPNTESCAWATDTNAPFRNMSGEIIGVIGTVRNITKRKEAEIALLESENLLKESQIIANLGTYTLDIHTGNWESSEILDTIFGIDNAYDKTLEGWAAIIHPEWRQIMLDYFTNDVIGKKIKFDKKYKIIRQDDKSVRWVHGLGRLRFDEYNQPVSMLGTISDITERKLAKELLANEKQRLSIILKGTRAGTWEWNIQSGEFIVNERWADIIGYTLKEILPINYTAARKFYQPDDLKTAEELLKKHLNKEIAYYECETRMKHKNGEWIWVVDRGRVYEWDQEGKPLLMSGTHQDITKRKKAELELIKLNQAIYSSSESILLTDKEGIITYINPGFTNTYGFTADEVINKVTPRILKSGLMDKEHYSVFWDLLLSGKEVKGEYKNKRKDGVLIDIEASNNAIFDAQKNIIGFLSIQRDISKRKQTEAALKESKDRLRRAQKAAKFGSWEWDLTSGEHYWSEENFTIYGLDSGKVKPSYEALIEVIDPADMELVNENVARAIARGSDGSFDIDYNCIRPDNGKKCVINARAEVLRDTKGNAVKLVGTIQDITERIKAEEKIREKDIEFRKLSSNVPDLIFQFTRRVDGTYCVPIASVGIRNIFGCSPEDVIDNFEPIGRVIHPEDMDRVIKDIEFSARHLSPFTCEFRVQIPGKEIQWIYSKSTPEKLADGSITWYGFNTDITERKKTEEAILLSYERYNLVAKATNDAIFDMNIISGEVIRSGDGFNTLFGYDKEYYSSPDFDYTKLIHPEDLLRVNESMDFIRKNPDKQNWVLDYRLLKANGEYAYVHDKGYIIRDIQGKAIRMIGATQDITDRIKYTQAIEAQNKQLREIAWTQSHIVRAPLARLIGLVNLIDEEGQIDTDTNQLLKYVLSSAHELDSVIKSIVMNTQETEDKFSEKEYHF
ncbi:MAG: PAS domain-containing protein [Bacteroidota bacterium]|nr:PAS domain-containing protein [Bacteroidota bacterium]